MEVSFDYLPKELFIEIFSFLSKRELLEISTCSRFFYECAFSQPIYRQLCGRIQENSYLFNSVNIRQMFEKCEDWKQVYFDMKELLENAQYYGIIFVVVTKFEENIVRTTIGVKDGDGEFEKKYSIQQALEENLRTRLLPRYKPEIRDIRYSFDDTDYDDDSVVIHVENISETLKAFMICRGDDFKNVVQCSPYNPCAAFRIFNKFKNQFRYLSDNPGDTIDMPDYVNECSSVIKQMLTSNSQNIQQRNIALQILFGNLI